MPLTNKPLWPTAVLSLWPSVSDRPKFLKHTRYPMSNIEKRSQSGLMFQLHPLVLINISDHHTRIKANNGEKLPSVRVLGFLLGQQNGRTVDISNSFEVNRADDGICMDGALAMKKMEQYKQTFPNLDAVGWYATGECVQEADMLVHHQMMKDYNESPVFLLLDPRNLLGKSIPVSLYESEVRVQDDGHPVHIFVEAEHSIATSEAERIGVEQVAKILPVGRDGGVVAQYSAHLESVNSSIEMLFDRLTQLHALLIRMEHGEIAFDHDTVRRVGAIVSRLPTMDTQKFKESYRVQMNDTTLTLLLSNLTKNAAVANSLVDKVGLVYERPLGHSSGSRRGNERGTLSSFPPPTSASPENELMTPTSYV